MVRGRGHARLRLQRHRVLRRPVRTLHQHARPRPRRHRRGGGATRSRRWPSSRCGRTPTRRPSSWPRGSPRSPRATSTASSSPPVAPRPSRARGSSRASTTRCAATTTATRSSAATSPITARRMGALTITSRERLPHALRAAGPGRDQGADDQLLPRARARRRPRGLRPVVGRPDRRGHPARGPRDGGRGLPRAGPERRGLLHARRRATGRAVREICDRYGVLFVSDEVICAFGRLGTWFGAAEVRLRPRHHHVRQGHHERLRAPRRDDRPRPGGRAIPARRHVPSPRLHVGRPPGPCAVALKTIEILRERARARARAGQRGLLPREPRGAARHPDRRATCAATGYFWGVELVKDQETKETWSGDERRAAAARLRVARAVPPRPHLPLRRPGRPRRPGRAAAHLRRARTSTSWSARCARSSPEPPEALGLVRAATRRCGGRPWADDRSARPPWPATSTSTSPSSAAASPGCGRRSSCSRATRRLRVAVLETERLRVRGLGPQRRLGVGDSSRSHAARGVVRRDGPRRLRPPAPRPPRRRRRSRRVGASPTGSSSTTVRGGTVTLARTELQAARLRASDESSRRRLGDGRGRPRLARRRGRRRERARATRARARRSRPTARAVHPARLARGLAAARRARGARRSTRARRSRAIVAATRGDAPPRSPCGGDRARRLRGARDRGVHPDPAGRAARRSCPSTRSWSRRSRSSPGVLGRGRPGASARRSTTTGTSSSTASAPPTTGSSSAVAARRTTSARRVEPRFDPESEVFARARSRRSHDLFPALDADGHPPLGRAARPCRATGRRSCRRRPRDRPVRGRRLHRRRRRAQPRRRDRARRPHRRAPTPTPG